jgi:DNA-binding NarL/FixJ family response regulator
VLADAHPVARLAMRHALERERVAVVAEAADAVRAVDAVCAHCPELCLLDGRLPGGAIAAARRIAVAAPATRVVVLLESIADEQLIEVLLAGAAGCLLKDTGPDALGRAVRSTLDGQAPLPRAAAGRVIEELRLRARERHVRTAAGTWTKLSEREAQVLDLLQHRLTTDEIAQRLGISAVTVRRHVSGTMRRLGARDREAALRLAAGQRLVHRA